MQKIQPQSRHLFQFLFFFITSIAFSQNNYLSIDIKPETEILEEPHYFLYKKDSLVYTNSILGNIFNVISDLEKGTYRLAYETIFGMDTLDIHFTSDNEFKEITLKTEKPSREMLAKTFSYIESLKNNEQITLEYSLGSCFNSTQKKATILKENDQYYFIDYGQKRLITSQRIKKIIRHEKILKNLKAAGEIYSTCNQFFTIEKDGKQLYKKHVICGTWDKFSLIKRFLR